MNSQKEDRRVGWRTTRRERVSYYIGDNAKSLEGAIALAFMTTFLLMSGINPVSVAIVTLIVKTIDALDDVIFGYLVDKLKPSQIRLLAKLGGNGKYLPWFRAMFWIFPLATVLLFMMPQGMSEWAKIAYFAVFYLLYDLTYTIVDVPMNSAIMTITDHTDERNAILTNKNIISMVMGLIAVPVMFFLISEKIGMSIKNVVLMMSVLMVAMMIPLFLFTKEHNSGTVADQDEKYTFRDMFLNVKNNRYLLLLFAVFLAFGCFATGDAVSLFVSYYLYGDSTILLIPMLVTLIPILIAQKITERLCSKYEKIRVCLIIQIIHLALRVLIFVVGYRLIVLHIALLILATIPSVMFTMAIQYMMMDCIEYGKYQSGKDCAGITFALKSFINKLTPSVASSVGLIILGLFGWVSIQAESFAEIAEKNIIQPDSALTGLWLVHAGAIIIGIALSLLFLLFYRLKGRDVKLMIQVNNGSMQREDAQQQMSQSY